MSREKFSVQLTTLSKLSISPRGFQAMYRGIDFKETDEQDFSQIYPFYSYSNRNMEETAVEYYIPGSSLKGALELNDCMRREMLFQDRKLENVKMEVSPVSKFQYVNPDLVSGKKENEEMKKPCYEAFFPNIGIEFLPCSTKFTMEVFIKKNSNDEDSLQEVLQKTHLNSINKLRNYSCKVKSILEAFHFQGLDENQTGLNMLWYAEKSLRGVLQEFEKSNDYLIFLGGFKGLLGANGKIKDPESVESGLYFDLVDETQKRLLPYGLAKIRFLNSFR